MNLLVDRARGARTIHVLIVGVGHHVDGTLDSLKGMGKTVVRLYDWWRDTASGRCLPGVSIGTVDVLASDLHGVSLRPDNGPERSAAEPTYSNVVTALRRWSQRAEQGGIGFLYWSGHGEAVGLEGACPTSSLLCSDSDDEGKLNGIDWDATLQGINARARAGAKFSCFVDACRSERGNGRKYRGALDYDVGANLNPAYVLMSAAEGRDAKSFGNPIVAAEFPGGPIATNSVIDALDRYAACRSGKVHVATPDCVNTAVFHRMRRIGSHIPELGASWNPMSPGHFPGWASEAILTVPTPHTMLDIEPPAGRDPAKLSCAVTQQADGKGWKVVRGVRYFESSVPYGRHEVVVCEMQGTTERVLFSDLVEASQPRQPVETI